MIIIRRTYAHTKTAEMSYLGRLYLGFLSAHNEFCRFLIQSNDELAEILDMKLPNVLLGNLAF